MRLGWIPGVALTVAAAFGITFVMRDLTPTMPGEIRGALGACVSMWLMVWLVGEFDR